MFDTLFVKYGYFKRTKNDALLKGSIRNIELLI